MRRSLVTAVVLVVVLAAASLALPAQAAAPTADLQPEKLPRGADVAVPHVEDGQWGDVFVDGLRRVELPGRIARVIGPSGDDWLVATHNVEVNRNRRVVRVGADGSVTDVLRNVETSTVILSADGSTLAWQRYVSKGRKVETFAARSSDGQVLGQRGVSSPVALLDVDSSQLVLSGRSRTFLWRFSDDRRNRTVTSTAASAADLSLDLLTTWTKDPYLGGCLVVSRLSAPREEIWRSCRDRVAAFSPDGTQMLTFHKLTDGLGPGEIRLRTIEGTKLATWTTGWFTDWRWESPGVVLLEANGKRKAATVRCDLGTCENATDPVRTPKP